MLLGAVRRRSARSAPAFHFEPAPSARAGRDRLGGIATPAVCRLGRMPSRLIRIAALLGLSIACAAVGSAQTSAPAPAAPRTSDAFLGTRHLPPVGGRRARGAGLRGRGRADADGVPRACPHGRRHRHRDRARRRLPRPRRQPRRAPGGGLVRRARRHRVRPQVPARQPLPLSDAARRRAARDAVRARACGRVRHRAGSHRDDGLLRRRPPHRDGGDDARGRPRRRRRPARFASAAGPTSRCSAIRG